jgi:hypothetical protein
MKKTIAVIFLPLFLFAPFCFGFDAGGKRFEVGLCGGILGGGNIDAALYSDFDPSQTVSFTSEPSFLGRINADYFILPYFGLGLCINYASISPKYDIDYSDGSTNYLINRNDISIMDLCVGLKTRWQVNDILAFKPGLYGGFRFSFSHSAAAREFGMAINGSIETQFYVAGSTYIFLDTGFLAQPYGGVFDIAYVRGGPIYYACVGIGF